MQPHGTIAYLLCVVRILVGKDDRFAALLRNVDVEEITELLHVRHELLVMLKIAAVYQHNLHTDAFSICCVLGTLSLTEFVVGT